MPIVHRSLAPLVLCTIATAIATTLLVRTPAGAADDADRSPIDIAVCDFVRLADEVFESDRFRKPREEFEQSLWPADLKAKKTEMETLEKRLSSMEEDSPDYADTYARWDVLSDEVWAKESEVRDTMNDREIRDRDHAFSLVVTTATDVAEEAGHRYVAMGGKAREIPDDATSEDAYEAIRFRVFLTMPVFPARADITDDVRFELGLK